MSVITAPAPGEPAIAHEPRPRRRRRRWTRFVLPTYSWLVIFYLVIPIIAMVVYSLNQSHTPIPNVSFAWNGLTTKWYSQWNQIPGLTPAFVLSLKLAAATTALATVLGTMVALALVRYRFRGRLILEQVMFVNIAAPEIVLGASLLGLFVTINLARGFLTLVLAHVSFSIAYVAITVRARLAGFDRSLEEAASDLGANAWVTFQKVTLPLIFPGVLAGALMAFALSIDDFVTSNFVAGVNPTFPLWVYGATRIAIPPQVLVFGTFLFAVGFMLAILSIVIQRRKV